MSTLTQAEINEALYGKQSRSKFNVDTSAKGKEARTWIDADGTVILFASLHEKNVHLNYVLPNLHVGVFTNVRRQVTFDLHAWTPAGFKVKVGTWRADWVCSDREGKPVIIDAKGKATDLYKLKRAIFEAEYGLRIMEL